MKLHITLLINSVFESTMTIRQVTYFHIALLQWDQHLFEVYCWQNERRCTCINIKIKNTLHVSENWKIKRAKPEKKSTSI